jgi:predicted permease
MGALRVLASRLLGFFRKRRLDEDLDVELRSHLELLTAENVRRGMTPEEARHAARREFGGVEQTKEDYRDTRGLPMLELFLPDLRYAFRTLRKNPGFAAIAVLTLALGIGANTAIFSIVNAVLLKPLPFPESSRIVAVYQTLPQRGVLRNGASYLNFADWCEQSRSFEAMGAFHGTDLSLTGSGDPEVISGAVVTSGLFSTLGVRPIAGRVLIPADDRAGAAPVVLMSERLWRRRFGAALDLIGRAITLDKQAFTVAGILPGDFQFPFQMPAADFWIPVQQDTQFKDLIPRRGGHYLSVIARVRAEIALGEAETELAGIQARLVKQYPAENAGWGVRLAPLQGEIVGDVRLGLLVLLGAVALVLLIACANVANLLLSRATSRSRELAVRAALGAGKKRIVRQLLTESLLLGGIGGALGAATAWWAVRGLAKLLPDDLPRIHTIQVDGSVLCFTLVLSVFVSLLFGLAPAVQATSANLVDGLKEGARGSSDGGRRRRIRGVLIASEVALAVVLLTAAGLLLRSFLELQGVSPGFRADGVLTASVTLPQSQYAKAEEWAKFYRRALERVRTLPGVTGAAVVVPLPMSGGRINLAFGIDGRPQAPEERISANYSAVSADYFRLLGIPLLRGRAFDERDAATSQKVTIISEAFARRYFAEEDPIGKHLSFGFPPDEGSREIAGIVGDVKQVSLDAPAEPEMYVPYEQSPMWSMDFAVRTAGGDPAALTSAVRERIQEADKDLPVVDVQPMGIYLHDSVAQPRFRTFLLGLFGVVALLLAAVGIYGVISYTVVQRTQEIGVRMALGAAPTQVLGLVVGQGMKLVLVGLAVGLMGTFGLTRFFRSLLFGITPGDPLTYFATVLVLVGVSLLACYVPARRAMRVDPLVALRYE